MDTEVQSGSNKSFFFNWCIGLGAVCFLIFFNKVIPPYDKKKKKEG